ncbi:uncharacterized protein LOC111333587 [Stylophora pistillata]|uniref:Uncharacterized protein C9orf172-like n=1 Tax=Stylophora pistillata TaxID=50429 RepID=A0A2B4SZ32_STYPI|nr:uncharacterized protein LOC111333587 [Stylophora pistillata]PFX33832.1 Uncharacterized protein C9orf172-like [Stylophora pistillata]
MWMIEMISLEDEYIPEEVEDGEISIVFWSFAFAFLLIVTVWFYITEIAPIRKSAGRQITDETDREEVVAKRILEHLSEDLQFKGDISKESSKNPVVSVSRKTEEDSSVYEYIEDEIHIHYSSYGWVDDNDGSSECPSGLAAGRRHSMENMDLIFPGFLPSIVEEEEIDGETDTESSDRSQETDRDSFQEDFVNLSTVNTEGLVNKYGGFSEISMDVECDYSKTETKIATAFERQEPATKDAILPLKPAETNSLYASETVDITAQVYMIPEPIKTELNGTSSLSRQNDDSCLVKDTENRKSIPSIDPALHSATQASAKTSKYEEVAHFTSGNFDAFSGKGNEESPQDDKPQLNGDVIESTSMFTIPNCDPTPTLEQDANETEEPQLCALNEARVSRAPENGVEDDFTRDIRSKHSENEVHAHDNIAKDLYSRLSKVPTEDTSGLTGTAMNINKSDLGEFKMNGFVGEIAESNNHTTHSWTFFSMSGSDEAASSEKGISSHKQQSDKVEVPKIIIDSYDDGLQSDKLIPNEESIDMNGNETASRYADSFVSDTFETDIDIDDVDLMDSDELGEEGEFSIYFKRHVSVTDLDKIISEEGQAETNDLSSEVVLETDLSEEEPQNSSEDVVAISTTDTVMSEDQETNSSNYATEATSSEDESNMNIQKSIIITSTLSDCLDKQQTIEDLEEAELNDLPHKSYAVETLMDDISFQKDGVYGELVLSKLNEGHEDQPEDIHLDFFGEDWSVFAEEYRRVRKPFLFTIPEDEEIGLIEVNQGTKSYPCVQPRTTNYSHDNESSVSKEASMELKAPIATVDASDSEYDLDLEEDRSGSDTEKSSEEIVAVNVATRQETKPGDLFTHDGVTENGVTDKSDEEKDFGEPDLLAEVFTNKDVIENGGLNDVLNLVNGEEMNFKGPVNVSDKIIYPNDGVRENRDIECDVITENHATNSLTDNGGVEDTTLKKPDSGVTATNGNNVTVENTRSVKIVKKIKIVVRKEVKVTKDEKALLSSSKQLNGDSDKLTNCRDEKEEKVNAINEALKKEAKEEEIIQECSEAKKHSAYNFTTTQIGPVCHITQPLNFVEGQYNVSRVNDKKMDTTTKKDLYTPLKPEPKVIEEQISATRAVASDRDVTQRVTQLVTQPLATSEQTKVAPKIEPQSVEAVIEARVSTVEASSPNQDIAEQVAQHLTKTEEESARKSPLFQQATKENTQEIEKKAEKIIAPESIKKNSSSAKVADTERDTTKHSEQSPTQKDQMHIKPHLELRSVTKTTESRISSVETLFKREAEQALSQPLEQKDKVKANGLPETESNSACVSPSGTRDTPKRDLKDNLDKLPSNANRDKASRKPDSRTDPKSVKARALPAEGDVTKSEVTQRLPAPNNERSVDLNSEVKATSESPKTSESSVRADVAKRDMTYRNTRVREQIKGSSVDPSSTTNKALENVKVTASSALVEVDVPKREIKQLLERMPTKDEQKEIPGKKEPKVTPKKLKDNESPLDDNQDFDISGDKRKESVTNGTKTDIKDEIERKPSRANVGLKMFISGKNTKEPQRNSQDNEKKPVILEEETPTVPVESPVVTISVQGKETTEGRESRRVRSPRTSPTKSLEKKSQKKYLSSRNIRLSKSHEDLRFVEKAHEIRKDSIKEEDPTEEVPDTQTPTSSLGSPANSVFGDDAIESIEPPSLHTAKITVQEVVGDKQRIIILNVKKKVHGKARWKSLNDLDSLNKALDNKLRRSSDLGNSMTSLQEEKERVEEEDGPKIVPVVQVKTRHGRLSLPEMGERRSEPKLTLPHRSPILKVTAVQDNESVPENNTPTRIKARVMPVLRETDTENGETTVELKEKEPVKQDVKARVTKISPSDPETRLGNAFITERENKEEKTQEKKVRVSRVSPVVEAFPRLERETVTEISEPATKGNRIKVHVARVSPVEDSRPGVDEMIARPFLSTTTGAKPTVKDYETSASQVTPIADVTRRQGRESGYGSLEIRDNDTGGVILSSAPIPVQEGPKERSLSSLSSLEDELYGEPLGESRIMVTDLDALLAQQAVPPAEGTSPPRSPDKHEVAERVQVRAHMGPVPKKVIRINSYEEEDGVVIRQVIADDPVVLEPVILAEAADKEESAVITAFPVNDGCEEDELDEVFLEEYPPGIDPNSANSSHSYSSDADSETSSVSSLPLKQRHRHTRSSLEAGNIGVRNRSDSSGSSKTATPVAELENDKKQTSSGSTTPELKTNDISQNESFSYRTPEHSRPAVIDKPSEFTSAFVSISRTTEIRRPRARSEHSRHKSNEEPSVESKQQAPGLQRKGLGASFQDVQLPGLNIDKERFKEAADSRKSMPDLSRKGNQITESPFLRGLSAHTRKWLSQNVWMDDSGQQDEEDLMTSDLFLYPSNRFQPGANIDASFMSLADDRERDFPDDISVNSSTLSTRPGSPMSEFSFAGDTPHMGLRRGSMTVIKCSNPRCGREEALYAGEKTTYTSCPACFTYYCNRMCRRIHWSEHKKVCFFGRINSYIRSFIYLCHKKEALKFQLSKAAREGFKRKGRGCVLVTFASAQSARKFMTTGCTFFPSPPTYSSLTDLQAEGVVSKHRVALTQHIKDYNPEEEFVLNLAIIAGKMDNLPESPVPRRKVNTVLQVVKVPLSNKLKEEIAPSPPSEPKTETKFFYLPKCSRHEFVNENEARRHYCRNISKNLKQYGIRLKNDYPDIYEKLCLYVDQNIRFTEPLTVYGNQGKKIVMCKIMPEAGDEVAKK